MENQNNTNKEDNNEKVSIAERNAIASLVLGILSIVLAGLIGILCSIIAMTTSKLAKEVLPNNSKATAGFVLGLIGLIVGIGYIILLFVI